MMVTPKEQQRKDNSFKQKVCVCVLLKKFRPRLAFA